MDRWREGRDAFLDEGQRVKSSGNPEEPCTWVLVDTLEREVTAGARARRVGTQGEVKGVQYRPQKLSQVRAGRAAGCR